MTFYNFLFEAICRNALAKEPVRVVLLLWLMRMEQEEIKYVG